MPRQRSSSVRSIAISDFLEAEQYGLIARNENKCTQLIGQFAGLFLRDFKAIACGGMAEKSTLREDRDADSDIMGTVKGFFVTEDNHLTFSGYRDDKTYISIIRNERYPGYCKLQLSQACYDLLRKTDVMLWKNGRAIRDKNGVIASVVKQEEKLLISSMLFNKNVEAPGLIPPENLDEPLFKQNGPAKRNGFVDYVRCLEFSKWPQEAKNYIKRQRKYSWPKREVLDTLENEVSCYVVPTGNKSSEEFDLEWRLSFVEIERELIWNMNDTQFKCYVCLKRLKKCHLNKTCEVFKKISTYQIKNIIFWMCEEMPETDWQKRYLLRRVQQGLGKLRNCIMDRCNPHYIIPKNNLWQNVDLSKSERREAIRSLKDLTVDISDKIITSQGNNNINYLPSLASPKIQAYSKRCNILLKWGEDSDEAQLVKFYHQLIEKFPETYIYLPCKEITKAKLRWLTILNVTREYRMSGFGEEDITSVIELNIRDVCDQMKRGYDIDYLTCSLNISMVYFVHRNFLEVLKELRSNLLHVQRKVYMTYDFASFRLRVGKDGVYHFDEESINLSDLYTHRQDLVLDFEVGKPETDFLPFPLKLQTCLVRNSCMSVLANPLVVGCYLLVLSEHYLGHTNEMVSARNLLVSVVSNRCSHIHNYHYFHLYLLGHSYYETGDMKEAYSCFAQSAISKPSLLNAAIYHIAIMINDYITFRKDR